MANQQMSLPNKVASVNFAGTIFQDRTRVYRNRAREMKKLMMEAYETGGKVEAYPYAMRILMIRKDLAILLETARRIKRFYGFTVKSMTDGKKMPEKLAGILDKCSYVTLYKGLIEIRQELTKFERAYGLDIDEVSVSYKKLTRKNARALLNAAVDEKNKKENRVSRGPHHRSTD